MRTTPPRWPAPLRWRSSAITPRASRSASQAQCRGELEGSGERAGLGATPQWRLTFFAAGVLRCARGVSSVKRLNDALPPGPSATTSCRGRSRSAHSASAGAARCREAEKPSDWCALKISQLAGDRASANPLEDGISWGLKVSVRPRSLAIRYRFTLPGSWPPRKSPMTSRRNCAC